MKDKYKVKNGNAYNQSLVRRGNLTLWLEDSVLRAWRDLDGRKKVVGENVYPTGVIQCCLLLEHLYPQPLRQNTDFVASLLALLGHANYAVPDYTTLSRRRGYLAVAVSKAFNQQQKGPSGAECHGFKSIWRRRMESQKTRDEQTSNAALLPATH